MYTKERGNISVYLAMAISIAFIVLTLVLGTEAITIPRAQATLQHAAEIIDRSYTQNGCLTVDAKTEVQNLLSQNQIDLKKTYLSVTNNTHAAYGQTTGAIELGYDLNLYLPGAHNASIFHTYIAAKIPNGQSMYTPNSGADSSGCATLSLSDTFKGTQGGDTSGGPSSTLTNVATTTNLTLLTSATAVSP